MNNMCTNRVWLILSIICNYKWTSTWIRLRSSNFLYLCSELRGYYTVRVWVLQRARNHQYNRIYHSHNWTSYSAYMSTMCKLISQVIIHYKSLNSPDFPINYADVLLYLRYTNEYDTHCMWKVARHIYLHSYEYSQYMSAMQKLSTYSPSLKQKQQNSVSPMIFSFEGMSK